MNIDYEIFNIRNLEHYKKYYPILREWWIGKGSNWTPIDPEFLSSIGLIIKYNNQYVCAGWLYKTDSSYGVLNWIITNNTSLAKEKKICLEKLFEVLESISKEIQIKIIYLAMGTNSLKRILKKRNYLEGSNNISEYFKKL